MKFRRLSAPHQFLVLLGLTAGLGFSLVNAAPPKAAQGSASKPASQGSASKSQGSASKSGSVGKDQASAKMVQEKAMAASTMAKIGGIDPEAKNVPPFTKPEEKELRQRLSKLQFDVTQHAATERSFTSPLWNNKRSGIYECVVCGQDLFASDTKYRSGTGWPSFYAPVASNNIAKKTDFDLGYPRSEVHCAHCEAHLGHVFNDGPQPTGQRYCINGASLNFLEMEVTKEKMTDKKMEMKKESE